MDAASFQLEGALGHGVVKDATERRRLVAVGFGCCTLFNAATTTPLVRHSDGTSTFFVNAAEPTGLVYTTESVEPGVTV